MQILTCGNCLTRLSRTHCRTIGSDTEPLVDHRLLNHRRAYYLKQVDEQSVRMLRRSGAMHQSCQELLARAATDAGGFNRRCWRSALEHDLIAASELNEAAISSDMTVAILG